MIQRKRGMFRHEQLHVNHVKMTLCSSDMADDPLLKVIDECVKPNIAEEERIRKQ